MSRRLLSVLALGIVASAAASLLAVSPALAHARYKSSTPGTGEAITASPAQVEIEFSQEIQKIAGGYGIEVVKDRGLDVTAGPAVVSDADRHKMSVPLQPDLAAGRYVVNWNNTSDEDGDPIKGAFSFYLNYQPNAVDLANDAQLATIGFEDVTAEAGTAAAEPTPPSGSAVSGTPTAGTITTPAAASTGGASATPAASSPTLAATPSGSSGDGGDSNTTLIIIVAVVVAAVAIGGGAWYFTSKGK